MCGLVGWMDRVGFVLCEVCAGVGVASSVSLAEAGGGNSRLLEVSL